MAANTQQLRKTFEVLYSRPEVITLIYFDINQVVNAIKFEFIVIWS